MSNRFFDGAMYTREVRNIQVAYELRGAGQPLLLLHGFTGCGADFAHAGREQFAARYRLIVPDARGHGASENDQPVIRHDECARDLLALLDQLGITRVRAIGLSMGGNVLLHMATLRPEVINAMVLVSATPRFSERARAIMRAVPTQPSPDDWPRLRAQHRRGDEQILALWRAQRALAEIFDDVCFTHEQLQRIEARTLVYFGTRDPLYPVSLGEELATSIPQAELELVDGGHCPVFLEQSEAFADRALAFLAGI